MRILAKRRDALKTKTLIERNCCQLAVAGFQTHDFVAQRCRTAFQFQQHGPCQAHATRSGSNKHPAHLDNFSIDVPQCATGDGVPVRVCDQVYATTGSRRVARPRGTVREQFRVQSARLDRSLAQKRQGVSTLWIYLNNSGQGIRFTVTA